MTLNASSSEKIKDFYKEEAVQKEVLTRLAHVVRQYQNRHGLTLNDLSNILGEAYGKESVSLTTVKSVLAESYDPIIKALGTLLRFCHIASMSPSEFVGYLMDDQGIENKGGVGLTENQTLLVNAWEYVPHHLRVPFVKRFATHPKMLGVLVETALECNWDETSLRAHAYLAKNANPDNSPNHKASLQKSVEKLSISVEKRKNKTASAEGEDN